MLFAETITWANVIDALQDALPVNIRYIGMTTDPIWDRHLSGLGHRRVALKKAPYAILQQKLPDVRKIVSIMEIRQASLRAAENMGIS